ncbi:hypothetical protein Kyoto204A_03560 [Helicobacter pylori]
MFQKKKKKKVFWGVLELFFNIKGGLNKIKGGLNKIKGGMPPISPNQTFSAV